MANKPAAKKHQADSRPAEPIADLVARLGPPPSIVLEDWREQLFEWIRHDGRATHKLSPHRLGVDAENRLSWIECDAQPATIPRLSSKSALREKLTRGPAPPASRALVQAFLTQVTTASQINAGSLPSEPLSAQTERPPSGEGSYGAPSGEGSYGAPAKGGDFVTKRRRPARHRPARRIRRTILAAASSAALAALVWTVGPSDFYPADRSQSNRHRSETAMADSAAQQNRAVVDEQPAPASRSNAFAADPLTAGQLSTLAPLATDSASESPDSPVATSALSLESLFAASPTAPSAAPTSAAPTSPLIDATDPTEAGRRREHLPADAADDAPAPGAEINSEQADGEQAEPRAVDAAVRVRRGPAVSLPASDAVEPSVLLVGHPITGLHIQMPASGDHLELAAQAEGRWAIQAGSSDEQPQRLAWIESTATETRFRWTAAAAASAAARRLPNARLRIDSAVGSSLLYLRPTIEIDPLPLGFEQLDQRTAWSLGSPIAAVGSRLQIELDLPEEVQLAWIAPPAAQPPRRMRVIAQLSSKEDEFVALRIRWDIQAGVRLSCRQRTAARLDASMPWQWVSLPALSQSADELIANLARQQQLLERLLAIYSDADYQQRKALRPRRDQLRQQVEAMSTMAERMSQLIVLLEQLEAQAAIRFELTTGWPDATQTILTTGGETEETS